MVPDVGSRNSRYGGGERNQSNQQSAAQICHFEASNNEDGASAGGAPKTVTDGAAAAGLPGRLVLKTPMARATIAAMLSDRSELRAEFL